MDPLLKKHLNKYQVEFDALLALKRIMEHNELDSNKKTATNMDSVQKKIESKNRSLIFLDAYITTYMKWQKQKKELKWLLLKSF